MSLNYELKTDIRCNRNSNFLYVGDRDRKNVPPTVLTHSQIHKYQLNRSVRLFQALNGIDLKE